MPNKGNLSDVLKHKIVFEAELESLRSKDLDEGESSSQEISMLNQVLSWIKLSK